MEGWILISCENQVELLEQVPAIDTAQVSWRSDSLYDLLVPKSRQRYDGQRRNFFAYAEWRYGLEDNVFFHCLEDPQSYLQPGPVVSYLSKLLQLLEDEDNEFPFIYSIEDADATGKVLLRSFLPLRGVKLEAGYDHCLADVDGVWEDLREAAFFEGVGGDGGKRRLPIAKRTVAAVYSNEFAGMLRVARTAQEFGGRLVLVASHPAAIRLAG